MVDEFVKGGENELLDATKTGQKKEEEEEDGKIFSSASWRATLKLLLCLLLMRSRQKRKDRNVVNIQGAIFLLVSFANYWIILIRLFSSGAMSGDALRLRWRTEKEPEHIRIFPLAYFVFFPPFHNWKQTVRDDLKG